MPNEIRLHNNAEGSRQIPKVLKDHQFRRALGFFGGGLCTEDKKRTSSKAVDNKRCLCQTDFACNNGKGFGSFKLFVPFISLTKLQEINGDQQTNWLQSEMFLKSIISTFQMAHTPNDTQLLTNS